MQSTIANGDTLPVVEEFYSVQGEGLNAGMAAYFVRLGGCDVLCPFCDSKNSWNISNCKMESVEDIARRASATPSCNVVITGGEPLMHNLDPLCQQLEKYCLSVWLETSGSHPVTGNFDWICVSPKKNKPPLDEVLDLANELKVVISSEDDLAMAEQYAQKVPAECALLMQAEWDNREKASNLIFDYVLKNPMWKISIQTHKILNVR
ncbi:MAG: 7-carboxy-7-deazaguanine synthase QueE [Bacteroidales bacterium]|nr:7-carboxy-7-deazaguanine synthase QueE [Bacteroidales bacterium]